MKRNATAVWQGSIKQGDGNISTESGLFTNAPYSFGKRFGDDGGTNPEELLAAAHASCYSMALSLVLGEQGVTPERIDTTASVTIEPDDSGFSITHIHLDVQASIPGAEAAVFEAAAEGAKQGCPVSKLFKGADITLSTHLKS